MNKQKGTAKKEKRKLHLPKWGVMTRRITSKEWLAFDYLMNPAENPCINCHMKEGR